LVSRNGPLSRELTKSGTSKWESGLDLGYLLFQIRASLVMLRLTQSCYHMAIIPWPRAQVRLVIAQFKALYAAVESENGIW
jgi:hypothetical protein